MIKKLQGNPNGWSRWIARFCLRTEGSLSREFRRGLPPLHWRHQEGWERPFFSLRSLARLLPL